MVPRQFLNRQIYYCIQFAIYGILRDSSHARETAKLCLFSVRSVCSVSDFENRGIKLHKGSQSQATMCRPCVWHSFILVFSLLPLHCSRSSAWRVQYENKFFAQNNIQFSIITLLLSNSLSLPLE